MSTVTIVTVTKDYRCMNHEQNWVRNKKVYSCFIKATDVAVEWIEKEGKSHASEFSTSDMLRRVFIESRCGNFAASVEEVCITD
jgi:hypothetical protein